MSAALTRDVVEPTPPPVLEPLVRRPRLEQHLVDGARRRVTLVCAPPGAGKSTLVASWFAELEPGRGRWVTASADDHAGVVDALLAAARGAFGVLVIDDAHHLTGPALTHLEQLLTALPASLDVVLVARADPPLSVTALRLHGVVREIRAAELAFTTEEAGVLLNQRGVHVRPADVARLHARAEGWAAGLRLMHCALERGATAASLAEDDTAAQAAVSDYLLEEVLERETPEVRRFLLRTSIADRLTPELAVLLADDPHGGAFLDDLQHRGLFVTALEQGWYRYHSLFAALLRARLRVEDPTLARELHRSAGRWYASQELAPAAERHARAGEDWALLGDLVRRRWRASTIDGSFDDPTIAGPLPAAAFVDPALALLAATGGPEPDVADAASLADETAVVARLHAGADGDARDVAPHRCRDAGLRLVAAVLDAEIALVAGDVATAAAGGLAVADIADGWVRIDGLAVAALALAIGGHIDQGLRLSVEPASWVGPGRLGPAAATLAVAVADAQRARPVDRARLEPLATHPAWVVRACARTLLAARTPDTGVQGLDVGLARHPLVGRLMVALGGLDVVDSTGSRVAVGGAAERAVLQARRALASGAPNAAAAAVATAIDEDDHPRTATEAAVIEIVVADDPVAAVDTALVHAAAHASWAPFVTHAVAIRTPLDAVARRSGPHQSVAIEVLKLLRTGEPSVSVEALTEREATVLQLLPSLMSNEEIAEAMHLSVNTVKTHLKALYRKLAVDRRREAVVRARELGIL